MAKNSNHRGALWEDDEVDALIAIWGEEDMQAKLEGATRNIKIFDTIAKRLNELGFEGRTAVQCREKMKKIKGAYRKAKSHNGKTGRDRKTLKYMDKLDSILGHRPANQKW